MKLEPAIPESCKPFSHCWLQFGVKQACDVLPNLVVQQLDPSPPLQHLKCAFAQ